MQKGAKISLKGCVSKDWCAAEGENMSSSEGEGGGYGFRVDV
jgi:hypothetical protein